MGIFLHHPTSSQARSVIPSSILEAPYLGSPIRYQAEEWEDDLSLILEPVLLHFPPTIVLVLGLTVSQDLLWFEDRGHCRSLKGLITASLFIIPHPSSFHLDSIILVKLFRKSHSNK